MSLKTLIQAALQQCDDHTIQHTMRQKTSAHYPLKKVCNVHLEKQLVKAIQEYCELSKLHSDVQALIDECLKQPTSAQIELLEHFTEQIVAWCAVHHELDIR